eukprot:599792-Prorocentrum_minimum.AAC.2
MFISGIWGVECILAVIGTGGPVMTLARDAHLTQASTTGSTVGRGGIVTVNDPLNPSVTVVVNKLGEDGVPRPLSNRFTARGMQFTLPRYSIHDGGGCARFSTLTEEGAEARVGSPEARAAALVGASASGAGGECVGDDETQAAQVLLDRGWQRLANRGCVQGYQITLAEGGFSAQVGESTLRGYQTPICMCSTRSLASGNLERRFRWLLSVVILRQILNPLHVLYTSIFSWDFQLEKNLVFALGWSLHLCNIASLYGSSCANNGKDALNTPESLHLCITQHPLFTFEMQGWGPRASPPIVRCTPRSPLLPTCGFYDEAADVYSTEGCGTMPSAFPLGANMFWRDIRESADRFPDAARAEDTW